MLNMNKVAVLSLLLLSSSSLCIFTCAEQVTSPWPVTTDGFDITVFFPTKMEHKSKQRKLAFGDYAEVPESCQAMTTCPLICVADETLCPTKCPEDMNLCADGTCSVEACDETLESPCECEEQMFACAKVNNYYNKCKSIYNESYAAYSECIENQEEELPSVSFTGPWFLSCYIWISSVTFLVITWCAYNKADVAGSTKSLAPVSAVGSTSNANSSNMDSEWTQIGYRLHWLGWIIKYLVWLTIWGIQVVLMLLTLFYYVQQEAERLKWNRPKPFHDEIEVLKAFELTWLIGLLWTFAFQWPHSIESLFFRRCPLHLATHVAVVAPIKKIEVVQDSKNSYGLFFARMFWGPFDAVLRAIFSYPPSNPDVETFYCKVESSESSSSPRYCANVYQTILAMFGCIQQSGVRSFYCRMGRYVYSPADDKYIPGTVVVGTTIGDFLTQSSGLTLDKVEALQQLVGENAIPMEKPTVFGCITKEFSKSFYVYQNFMVWTWFPYWFYYMAIVNTCIRVIGGIVVAVFQYISDSVLYGLSCVEGSVEVVRDGIKYDISVRNLVPGDVVVLKPGVTFSDMVVVKSDHLVVDEAAVTGESTPIMKTKLDITRGTETYDLKRHKIHTIVAGTEILETGDRGEDLGLVLTTGSFTMKGKLLTEILSYQRHKFLFDDEIKAVLLILGLQALVLITLVLQWQQEQIAYAFFYGVFILGTVIPPLLPTVFVVSVGISANRLQKKRITCTNSDGILVAGKVDMACFDKTGTLTEAKMEFVDVQSENSESNAFATLCMALCHSCRVGSTGELFGSHVDKALFNASGASIETVIKDQNLIIEHKGKKYSIVKNYEFDNHRQTQSVVVRSEAGSTHVFVKGSPEAIRALCRPETIPKSFSETLRAGAKSGTYQLALAHKEYEITTDLNTVSRDNIEMSLNFCGFIGFQNKLKAETQEVVKDLMDANIMITMITGDSVLTGICMAREAGICRSEVMILGQIGDDQKVEWVNVDSDDIEKQPLNLTKDTELALSGDAWASLLSDDPDYAYMIAKHVRVFGRCNPSDKVSVVSALVHLGCVTLMCGDGQNDCGALKSAHIGVALSSSDASVVAPFTSLDKTVSSVTEVIREGRCALSSALKVYSYYIMYGQVETYLQTINAYMFITFAEWCWVFMDGLWSSSMAFSIPLAEAASKLSKYHPTASLFGPRTMFSVCGVLAWNFFFLVMALVALNHQEWYQCRKWDSTDVSSVNTIGDNYESETLFLVGGFQYLISAFAFNFGYTFRAAWYKNYVFVVLFCIWAIMQLTATLYPSSFSCIWRANCDNDDVVRQITTFEPVPINNPFNTTVLPEKFRWILFTIMMANFVTICLWEYFFVNGFLYKIYNFEKDNTMEVSNKATGKVVDESVLKQ